MSLINHRHLINLPVYTQSQQYLGRVCGFELNTNSHLIYKYFVSKSGLVKELLNALSREVDLEIASAQVVSLDNEKMIVEDNVVADKTEQAAKIAKAIPMSANFKTFE